MCISIYTFQSHSVTYGLWGISVYLDTFIYFYLLHLSTTGNTFAINATAGQRTYQDSVPSVSQSYPSSSYGDEITLAALFLAVAANSASKSSRLYPRKKSHVRYAPPFLLPPIFQRHIQHPSTVRRLRSRAEAMTLQTSTPPHQKKYTFYTAPS